MARASSAYQTVEPHYVDLDKAPAGDYPNNKLYLAGRHYIEALENCVEATKS
jgi:hypothetical protein